MCVCVFSSHSFWTSSSLDVPAGVTQEEGHTGFLIHLLSAVRALIFLARRIQPFLSLVDREVEFYPRTGYEIQYLTEMEYVSPFFYLIHTIAVSESERIIVLYTRVACLELQILLHNARLVLPD